MPALKRMSKADFEALSFKERRMLVAADVLAQLKAKKYLPSGGDGFGSTYVAGLGRLGSKCEVCAIGAACVSTARVTNMFTAVDADELAPIDALFNMRDGRDANMRLALENCYESAPYEEKARERRLRAIFENILVNGGDFVRSQVLDEQHDWGAA